MLKDRIVAEVLAHRESGVVKVDDDYQLDSLAKLEVVAYLEGVKAGFLDQCFDRIADAASLDAIVSVFEDFSAVGEAA